MLLYQINDINDQKNISGVYNSNLKVIEQIYDVSLDMRGGDIILSSNTDKIEVLKTVFDNLSYLASKR